MDVSEARRLVPSWHFRRSGLFDFEDGAGNVVAEVRRMAPATWRAAVVARKNLVPWLPYCPTWELAMAAAHRVLAERAGTA